MKGKDAMSEPEVWMGEPEEPSKPFFEGARDGRLMLQTCDDCGSWHYPVRARCGECGGTRLSWSPASGRGTVYSHGRLRRVYHPRHEGRLPLILAVIDLDEGVRINSNLVDVEPEAVRAGLAVEVSFERFPDGGVIPVFRPAPGA
jgi:uncharacterized OB-fold protein